MSGGVLFEFVQVGQIMRVTAMDEATGTEVFVVTSVKATQLQMKQIAMAKLRRKLDEPETEPVPTPPRPSGRYA